jgi:hypothetical protein
MDEPTMRRLAARLTFLEQLVQDLTLSTVMDSPDPDARRAVLRAKTMDKVRQALRVPPGTSEEGVEIALGVQAEMLVYGEDYFDVLQHNLSVARRR